MTKGSDKIDMDSFDDSVYMDCTPLFSETLSFGEHYMPVLQGLENPEKHVYFDTPDCSMANLPDQSEGDLSNEGQGHKGGIFPVWKPFQLEEDVFLQPQDPSEDNGLQVNEQILQEGVHLEENPILPPQDPWEDNNGFQVDEQILQWGVHLGENVFLQPQDPCEDNGLQFNEQILQGGVHLEENAILPPQDMNGEGLNAHECVVQIHQGMDQPLADTIPPGPSNASEGQVADLQPRRRRGRPRKLPSPAPQSTFEITRRPRTKRTVDKIMKGAWSKVVSQNVGWLNAVQNHHSVASEAPEEANLPLKRRRGRPRKLAPTNKLPEKRPEFVLPAGWTIKDVLRKNGKSAGRKDTYYIEDATGHQCRSQVEVTRYLELKATQQG